MGRQSGTPYATDLPQRTLTTTPFIMTSLAAFFISVITLVLLLDTVPATGTLAVPPSWVETTNSDGSPADSASDGVELTLEEHGYSVFEGSNGYDVFTWGPVIVNNSSEMAANAVITVRPIAEDGTEITTGGNDLRFNAIPPGGRIGVGDAYFWYYKPIEDLELTVTQVEWWPEPADPAPEFSVGEVQIQWAHKQEDVFWEDQTGTSKRADSDALHIQLKVESPSQSMVSYPLLGTIFRDSSGAIIGGFATLAADMTGSIPPGWSYQRLVVEHVPTKDFDESAIEVYINA